MTFPYIFGKNKRRDEKDDPIVDQVVADTIISSMLPPRNAELKDIHKLVPMLYNRAKKRITNTVTARSSWVWKNMKWIKKDV